MLIRWHPRSLHQFLVVASIPIISHAKPGIEVSILTRKRFPSNLTVLKKTSSQNLAMRMSLLAKDQSSHMNCMSQVEPPHGELHRIQIISIRAISPLLVLNCVVLF